MLVSTLMFAIAACECSPKENNKHICGSITPKLPKADNFSWTFSDIRFKNYMVRVETLLLALPNYPPKFSIGNKKEISLNSVSFLTIYGSQHHQHRPHLTI
jgi:hypothetical protein